MCQLSHIKVYVILLDKFHFQPKKLKNTQDQSAGILRIIFHLT